ncbi:MAG: nucleotidyl transferase AbiEii/AbiGii toxin family protein [Rhodocyclaceae bacterium]|nr:nucleotidyl transferase AbiEii/AbiGii toxin family protein [Rhodocyclaceae bacterium]
MLYLDLFAALHDYKVRYILVGGLAMNLHGVPRMTMDVDIVLAMDNANLDLFIECARAMKLSPVAPVDLGDLKDPNKRRDWFEHKHMIAFGLQNTVTRPPTMVDVLVAPQIDIAVAFSRAIATQVGNTVVQLASIEDMIQLKTATGRAQDQSDIEHLERLRDQ